MIVLAQEIANPADQRYWETKWVSTFDWTAIRQIIEGIYLECCTRRQSAILYSIKALPLD